MQNTCVEFSSLILCYWLLSNATRTMRSGSVLFHSRFIAAIRWVKLVKVEGIVTTHACVHKLHHWQKHVSDETLMQWETNWQKERIGGRYAMKVEFTFTRRCRTHMHTRFPYKACLVHSLQCTRVRVFVITVGNSKNSIFVGHYKHTIPLVTCSSRTCSSSIVMFYLSTS